MLGLSVREAGWMESKIIPLESRVIHIESMTGDGLRVTSLELMAGVDDAWRITARRWSCPAKLLWSASLT